MCNVRLGAGGGLMVERKKTNRAPTPPKKTVHTDQKVPQVSVHIILFDHLQLAVNSTVVPNIYLHTKKKAKNDTSST